DLPDPELVPDDPGVPAGGVTTPDPGRAQRLAEIDPGFAAGAPSQFDDLTGDLHGLEEIVVGRAQGAGPSCEMDRIGCVRTRPRHQHLPEMLGEEWHDRAHDADRRDHSDPESAEGGCVVLVEAPAVPTDVPVGEVVQVRLEHL